MFKVTEEDNDGIKAKIVLEPLEGGFGHTLGNGLRRTMLTSLIGAAITSVKISGVQHQFSTIPGVLEDVIQIILNLKKVRVKLYSDKPIHIKISKSGIGEVKASDIDTMGGGEVVNKDAHIATLSDSKAKLNIEMTVESGVGYISSDERKMSEIGVLPVDAIFSPVMSVNYTVDQTRVGRKTDFDKLTLDVITDGTVSPLEAVQKAAQILSKQFKQIYEPEEIEASETSATPSFITDDVLKASVEELDLPVRITNALKAIEVDTIGKLTTVSPAQLMKAKNLGAKSLNLISEKLSERGLTLSEA
ncbi:DNA-directed RNA polymerase subunit alpha [Candidatus Daviesbacteria bacterium]|nr:DNA-directed RNA polymerase subunit alpha [Candidatus Daviesbacteria bacterium]